MLTYARPGDTVHISEMFRLVRGTGHILDVLDVLHGDQVALRIHDGAFSAMRGHTDTTVKLTAGKHNLGRHGRASAALAADLEPAERVVLDQGVTVRRGQGYTPSPAPRASSSSTGAGQEDPELIRALLGPRQHRPGGTPPTPRPLPAARQRRGDPGTAQGRPRVREPRHRSPRQPGAVVRQLPLEVALEFAGGGEGLHPCPLATRVPESCCPP
ncbi:hypothetical protein ACFZDJ_12105 [Streptomyces sp. NPDC007896]|uniref:hypothetical protein n=1 Tax=Streptomyces TaxID=1883 RepID=UPI0036E02585